MHYIKGVNNNMENIKGIIDGLSRHKNIVAITLGGSRATGNNDAKSDYDMYIYYDEAIDKDFRKSVLEQYCGHMEIAVDYFEEEDDCILNNGIIIELIYRNISDIRNYVENLMTQHQASLGYTTCFLDNLTASKVLYEDNGCYTDLKNRIFYPEELRRNIISKNMEMLHGVIASYDTQIIKAYQRQDMISVNHRIAAYLASYFDILFAVNKVYHPGEKRLIALAKKKCSKLPVNFEHDINQLLNLTDIEQTLDSLYQNLKLLCCDSCGR